MRNAEVQGETVLRARSMTPPALRLSHLPLKLPRMTPRMTLTTTYPTSRKPKRSLRSAKPRRTMRTPSLRSSVRAMIRQRKSKLRLRSSERARSTTISEIYELSSTGCMPKL